jgi:hypothetical protein
MIPSDASTGGRDRLRFLRLMPARPTDPPISERARRKISVPEMTPLDREGARIERGSRRPVIMQA